MSRKIFIASTLLFWLAVFGIWAATTLEPKPPARDAGKNGIREYALVEIARHNTPANCWMAIRGEVYDLSAYLPDHPSRPEIVTPWCGKEATEAYETKTMGRPHSPYADKLLIKYRVGMLNPRR